jgi:hypothetical protein
VVVEPAGCRLRISSHPTFCPLDHREISERIQEGDQVGLVRRAEVGEIVTSSLALAGVGEDRLGECTRPAIVEETREDADAPERCRPHLGLAGSRLRDAVSQATHVVEQEVGEREERDRV